jgi:hypothetical protein
MSLLIDVYKEIDILQERIHVVYVACRRYRHQHAGVVKLYSRRTLIWHPCIKVPDGSWESRHVDLQWNIYQMHVIALLYMYYLEHATIIRM